MAERADGRKQKPDRGRRRFVAAAGALGAAGFTGCLTAIGGDDGPEVEGEVVLQPPENYESILEIDPAYPVHGESLPDAEVHDVVRDETVSTRGFVNERHVLITFIFTDCPSACPALEACLTHAQAEAAEKGYADDVALIAVTFDPENDTPEVLREHGETIGVDYDANNWYFLRPDDDEHAREVVEETFGQYYRRNEPDAMMRFDHLPLLVLANKDGYVERAYANEPPSPRKVLDDLNAVVEGY